MSDLFDGPDRRSDLSFIADLFNRRTVADMIAAIACGQQCARPAGR